MALVLLGGAAVLYVVWMVVMYFITMLTGWYFG
jgi:hypothetical protein